MMILTVIIIINDNDTQRDALVFALFMLYWVIVDLHT